MIGQSQCWLAKFDCLFDQIFDPAQPVEQRIFRVDVQMHKIVGHDGSACSLSNAAAFAAAAPCRMDYNKAVGGARHAESPQDATPVRGCRGENIFKTLPDMV
jgi:hypothetical protein